MEGVISDKAAKVLDLLEQIESVNEMIKVHEGDPFMKDQYVYRKEGFVKELVEELGQFQISPEDLVA